MMMMRQAAVASWTRMTSWMMRWAAVGAGGGATGAPHVVRATLCGVAHGTQHVHVHMRVLLAIAQRVFFFFFFYTRVLAARRAAACGWMHLVGTLLRTQHSFARAAVQVTWGARGTAWHLMMAAKGRMTRMTGVRAMAVRT